MTPTKRMPAWLLYLLIEVGIVGAWLLNWLNTPNSDFSVLYSVGALKALVELETAWVVACAAHWRMTGDPTPVEAVAVIAPAAAEPDVAERMRELDERLETHFAGLAALLRPEPVRPKEPDPASRPEPPPLPQPGRRAIGVPPTLAELPPMTRSRS